VSVYRMKLRPSPSARCWPLAGALFAHQQGYIVSDTFTFDSRSSCWSSLSGGRAASSTLIARRVLVILLRRSRRRAYDILPKSEVGLRRAGLLVACAHWAWCGESEQFRPGCSV